MTHLGQRLRTLRTAAGLTQQDLAVKAGTTVTTIARIETGYRWDRPTGGHNIKTLEKVARALEVPLADLFIDDDDPDEAVEPARPV